MVSCYCGDQEERAPHLLVPEVELNVQAHYICLIYAFRDDVFL
jgi:hypothetical protein